MSYLLWVWLSKLVVAVVKLSGNESGQPGGMHCSSEYLICMRQQALL